MTDNGKVSGVLAEIKFHKDNYLIGRLEDGTGIKGNLAAPHVGMEYVLTGHWERHPRFGNTFVFSDYRSAYPTDLGAIRAYLAENCRWVGLEISKKLVNTFGKNTLKVCKDQPMLVAAKIAGITKQRAGEISAMLKNNEANEELQLALKKVLEGTRVSRRAVNAIIKKYGQSAPSVIQENPYRLIEDIDGVGFLSADQVARKVGFEQEGTPRIRAGILHVLKEAAFGDGHACLPRRLLLAKVSELLGVEKERVEGVLVEMHDDQFLRQADEYFYLSSLYEAERSIAEKLKILVSQELESGKPETEGLFPDQVEAIEKAIGAGAFILTGCPGTGKTFTIRRIINSFPDARIALAAPSGKAARRMQELAGRPAQTIHKLLEPNKVGDRFVFTRDADNPISADIIIIDETSMVDVNLMASLLDAVSPHSRLILVGDSYQLPSVGPGNVLKDLIASGVIPCAELTIIKRQDPGLITTNCHRIKNGQGIKINNSEGSDFFFLKRESETEIRETILDLVTRRIPESYGVDPLRDVQILSPLREKSSLSCRALNEICQQALNPNPPVKGSIFRKGDKVINKKNNYDFDILNGDVGYVRAVDPDEDNLTIDFENPSRTVSLPLRKNDIELAYVITVHSFQGSEASIIIVPVHSCLGTFIPQRSWIYTAVSRARRACILIGQREEIPKIIGRNKQLFRHTGLLGMLKGEDEAKRCRAGHAGA